MSVIDKPKANDRDESTSANVESLVGGVSVEWIEDRQIVIFRTPDSSRKAIDALFDRAEQIVRSWPEDRPYLAILDFTADKIGATPYARERGQALLNIRPELRICMVMLIGRSVQAQFFQVMARTRQRANKLLSIQFSREEAVAWLKKVGSIV